MAKTIPGLRPIDGQLFRVARRPDPWTWVPWRFGPFEGRWDDPFGLYRVLYVGQSRFACLVESLAAFRPDPKLLTLSAALQSCEADGDFDTLAPGEVPASWADARVIGAAESEGRMLAVGEPETLAWLRPRIANLLIDHAMPDLDGGAIRSADRSFTQALSRWLYGVADGHGAIDGIEFESRHGNRLVLWAIFERAADGRSSRLLRERTSEPVRRDDPDLIRALGLHRLALVPG